MSNKKRKRFSIFDPPGEDLGTESNPEPELPHVEDEEPPSEVLRALRNLLREIYPDDEATISAFAKKYSRLSPADSHAEMAFYREEGEGLERHLREQREEANRYGWQVEEVGVRISRLRRQWIEIPAGLLDPAVNEQVAEFRSWSEDLFDFDPDLDRMWEWTTWRVRRTAARHRVRLHLYALRRARTEHGSDSTAADRGEDLATRVDEIVEEPADKIVRVVGQAVEAGEAVPTHSFRALRSWCANRASLGEEQVKYQMVEKLQVYEPRQGDAAKGSPDEARVTAAIKALVSLHREKGQGWE